MEGSEILWPSKITEDCNYFLIFDYNYFLIFEGVNCKIGAYIR